MQKCSFCAKDRSEVLKLIMGDDNAFICNECVDLSLFVLQKERVTKSDKVYPHEIKEYLDDYVIGQDNTKQTLSVAAYNHYKRVAAQNFEKSNILMIGPTGSGKTLLIKTLAKALNVPLIITDATSLTETGYVGDDVEHVISRLFDEAGKDIKRAESGIIYLDEIDKIAKRAEGYGLVRDISGEGVQQALLKLAEGTKVTIPLHSGKSKTEYIEIDTTNILFIGGGTFVGLNDIINKRHNTSSTIGFNSVDNAVCNMKEILPKDLKEYGFIPEFIGRFPILTHIAGLTEEAIARIVTEPHNSIFSQYQNIFRLDDIELILEDKAATEIARRCVELETNARGIRAILEELILPHQFNIGYYVAAQVDTIKIDNKLNITTYIKGEVFELTS